MQIAIIGTGRVGSALASGLAGTEHRVTLGARDPQAAKVAVLAARAGAAVLIPHTAAAQADLVMLALPWAAARSAIEGLGDLTGKIIVDCMNPLGMRDGRMDLLIGHDDSGGETVARWLPGAEVVKTLNQVGAEIIEDARRLPLPPVMFMAGDSATAKSEVGTLLAEIGFEPLDAGDLRAARLLEPLAMVWINQAIARGKGRDWAFAAVSPRPHTPN